MIHLIMISAIALAIGIGYRTKINIGLLAIAFSYLIATTLMGLSPKELLHFWPTSLFFTIFSVSLFYNVATTNGTLDVLAQHILYRTRTHPNALYMILYLMATLLSALGAGFFTTMAVCCPLAITLCQKADKHPLIGAQALSFKACLSKWDGKSKLFHLAIISLSSALSTHSSSCFYYPVTVTIVREEQTHP